MNGFGLMDWLYGLFGVFGLSQGALVDMALVVMIVLSAVSLSRYATKMLRMLFRGRSRGEVTIVVNLLRGLLIFIVIYVVGENIFHLELTGIAQALGVTTLVVSLGMQDLIKNVVAGVLILLSRDFSVGDQLEVNGKRGEVMDISWRETVVRDKDNNPHVIPNSTLMSGAFIRRDGKMARRYVVECDIKPGLDLDRVAEDIQQLADAVLEERGWKAEEPTEVRYIGSTANGVCVSVRIFLKDIKYTTRGQDAVMRAIAQRGYLADWTNENPAQEQWR